MDLRRLARGWQEPLPRWLEVTSLILILGVGAWFRLYQIGRAPPGPHYDEAAAGLDALDVLDGRHMIFSPRSYGREMLFVYVTVPFLSLLGPDLLALRLPVALVGIVTILATFLLGRELFIQDGKRQAQWTALLSAAFLALSFWHLALNHLNFRANYLPLIEVLCFLFLWRAFRTNRLQDYILSGFFLGLSLHTYTAARFVPLVFVLFFALLLATKQGRKLVLPNWQRWLLLALVALVVFAPLLAHFVTHPAEFFLRTRGLSIVNPALHQGNLGGLFVRSLSGNLAMFGIQGDQNWVYNIPGRPGLDPVQAVLFWAGLILCLIWWRRPPYLFLVIWWLMLLMPSILAPDPIPHSLRAIGTLPAVSILSARTLVILLSSWSLPVRRLRTALPVAFLLLLPLYLFWTGYDTWRSYFHIWLPRDEVYYAYYGHIADLAETINQDQDPEAIYLFPLNYDRRNEDYKEYGLELLHRGPVPFRYIVADDATLGPDLTEALQGKRRVHLVMWTHGGHIDADPRQVLPFYLQRLGRFVDGEFRRGYRILTYELASDSVDFGAAPDFVLQPANFSRGLRLLGHAYETTPASGEVLWLALQWEALAGDREDYKASLRLVDAQGHVTGQVDSWLLSNEHQFTSQWSAGQVVTTYHLLPSQPGTLPGTYSLDLAVYDPQAEEPIWLLNSEGKGCGDRLSFGALQIIRPWRQQQIEPETVLPSTILDSELELSGYDLDRQRLHPGETLHLALCWRVEEDVPEDYSVVVALIDNEGQLITSWSKQPTYPTSSWESGDAWRDWHDLKTTSDLQPGAYQLAVWLAGATGDASGHVVLQPVQIEGRPRLFDVPDIEHRLCAQLGDHIRLLGYGLRHDEVHPDTTLHLTLYWQALAQPQQSYTVFTHLLDGEQRIWGQRDNLPGGGELPTISWAAGEVIVDVYEIEVAADAPPGDYVLEVGMYDASTGQRLPVAGDEAGRVLLDTTIVVDPDPLP